MTTKVTISEQATNHLQAVLEYVSHGYIELRALKRSDDGSMTPNGSHFIDATPREDQSGEINAAVEWAKRRHKSGSEIYIGYNARSIQAGTKEAVTTLNAFYADLDLHGADYSSALLAIDSAPARPNLVVDSGNGLHLIWFTAPHTDKVEWTNAQAAIQKHFEAYGADLAVVKDESRVLRLTPFANLKNGERKPTSILQFSPLSGEIGAGQIRSAFGGRDYNSDLDIIVKKNELPETFVSGERNNLLTRLAGALRRLNLDQDTLIDVLSKENNKRCHPPLEQREVISIARSVARYAGESDWLGQTADTTLDDVMSIGMSLGQYLTTSFDAGETLIFGLRRAEIGLVQAISNIGKSTLMRNMALALSCGIEFAPLVESGTPRRVLLVDFEERNQLLRDDFATMSTGLTPAQQFLVNENLHVIAEGEFKGAELNMTNGQHLDVVERYAIAMKADLIIMDTVAAGFSLNNENDNSEVQKKVVTPMNTLGKNTRAAVLLVHHRGKSGEDGGMNAPTVYGARGASALGAAVRLTIDLTAYKDGGAEGMVLMRCAKVKGPKFSDTVYVTNERTRWMENSEVVIAAPANKLRQVASVVTSALKRAEIAQRLSAMGIVLTEETLKRRLSDCVECGYLARGATKGVYEPTQLLLDELSKQDEQDRQQNHAEIALLALPVETQLQPEEQVAGEHVQLDADSNILVTPEVINGVPLNEGMDTMKQVVDLTVELNQPQTVSKVTDISTKRGTKKAAAGVMTSDAVVDEII